MKKRKGIEMSLQAADAHQRKHGFPPLIKEFVKRGQKAQRAVDKTIRKMRIGGPEMTQTEREFDRLLARQKLNHEIIDYRFHGVVLMWGDGMRFTADFSVNVERDRKIKLIEVKAETLLRAPAARGGAIVRFKGCRAEWKDWFDFEFWMKNKDGLWNQLA